MATKEQIFRTIIREGVTVPCCVYLSRGSQDEALLFRASVKLCLENTLLNSATNQDDVLLNLFITVRGIR